jgi:phosphoglycolate phosphatase-like HAD superfamily hydrolase
MIKAIIFDFDGIIADSNNVKTEAFVELFKEYPEDIKGSIRKFHLENGGMSRFDKFRYIYANFLREELPEGKFNKLCSDFNKLVIDGVINAPLFDGVEGFLKKNKGIYDMYIVSGTPDYEIKEIVKRRKLNKYFSMVLGSPRAKKELIEEVLSIGNYQCEEIIFLGDSINDYEGAVAAGIEFVAKIHDNLEYDLFPGVPLKIKINTIKQFEKYLTDRKINN